MKRPTAMPAYRRRQLSVTCLYGLICLVSLNLSLQLTDPEARAFGLGLAYPGAGFLQWAANGQGFVALAGLAAALLLFAFAVLVWFATGNVLLPPLVWIGAAGAAAHPELFGLRADLTAPTW